MLVQNTVGADKQVLLQQLTAEHRALKSRMRELHSHTSLTSSEQVEYSQLKKLKLRAKDRMAVLQQSA